MTVFIVITEDRHTDTSVHAFSVGLKAIEWAKERLKGFDRFGDYREHQLSYPMMSDGWIFYATCGDDGPSIRVVETQVMG